MKTIYVEANGLAAAWEQSVLRCWHEGESFKTEYDKAGDPESRDVTAMIHVKDPFKEPRIHRAFPGEINDLERYRLELLEGVHDYFMDDKTNTERWQYTYHERLFEYKITESVYAQGSTVGEREYKPREKVINQIDRCVELLKRNGHTRRAQAVTWQAWKDLYVDDAACLQRTWFRVQKREDGKEVLNMTVNFRSNDAYRAAYFNMYALTELQKLVADQVGVDVGEYVHIASSFHIYGSYFDEFKGFLNMVEKREFEDRTYRTEDALFFFIQGCESLLKEDKMPEDKKQKVRERKAYLESLL
jgi:thymidylate synthase